MAGGVIPDVEESNKKEYKQYKNDDDIWASAFLKPSPYISDRFVSTIQQHLGSPHSVLFSSSLNFSLSSSCGNQFSFGVKLVGQPRLALPRFLYSPICSIPLSDPIRM